MTKYSRLADFAKLLAAGLFVIGGLFGTIVLVSILRPSGQPVWIVVPIVVLLFFALIIAALTLFNAKSEWPPKREDPALLARQLDLAGLLDRQMFCAKRAFQIEEFEDEGSSYFLELDDGRVLILTGQYLWDYEPTKKVPRTFPNTSFEIQRHNVYRHVINIACSGTVLEPEALAPPFDIEEIESQGIPSDGQIFGDKSYGEIKTEWIDARKRKELT